MYVVVSWLIKIFTALQNVVKTKPVIKLQRQDNRWNHRWQSAITMRGYL